MALTGRRINNFLELVASGGMDIWVSSTSFQKSNNIGWPQQPLTEKVLISLKYWISNDTFYKKEPLLGSFWWQGWFNHQKFFFWWNEAVNVIKALEVVEAAVVLRSVKSPLRTSESSRFFKSALFLCFGTFSFRGCWG